MKKLPTADEFYDKSDHDSIIDIMIDFAKLHVEAALKEASKKTFVEFIDLTSDEIFDYSDVLYDDNIGITVNKESILNAYPLTNIK